MGGNAVFSRKEQSGEKSKQKSISIERVFKHPLIESAVKFLESVKKEDSTVLLYHKDGDGICGGFFIAKALQLRGIQIRKHFIGDPLLLKNEMTIREIISQKPSTIVAVDLPIDQSLDELRDLKEKTKSKILVIDHHLLTHDLNNYGITHVTPHLFSDFPKGFDPSQLCGTMLSYEISRKIAPIEPFRWALAGVICDCGKNVSNDNLERVYHAYSKETMEKLEDVLTIYGHGGSVPSIALDAMLHAIEPEDIIEGNNLWANKIMSEYPGLVEARDQIINDAYESIKQERPIGTVTDFIIDKELKSIIIEISHSKFLASDIATIISRDVFVDHVVTVIQIHDGTTKAKFRCQSGDVNVKKVAYKIRPKLAGLGAGGHKKSSGAEYPTEYIEKSKTEIANAIKEERADA